MNSVTRATAEGLAAIDLSRPLEGAAARGSEPGRAAFDATLAREREGAEIESADEPEDEEVERAEAPRVASAAPFVPPAALVGASSFEIASAGAADAPDASSERAGSSGGPSEAAGFAGREAAGFAGREAAGLAGGDVEGVAGGAAAGSAGRELAGSAGGAAAGFVGGDVEGVVGGAVAGSAGGAAGSAGGAVFGTADGAVAGAAGGAGLDAAMSGFAGGAVSGSDGGDTSGFARAGISGLAGRGVSDAAASPSASRGTAAERPDADAFVPRSAVASAASTASPEAGGPHPNAPGGSFVDASPPEASGSTAASLTRDRASPTRANAGEPGVTPSDGAPSAARDASSLGPPLERDAAAVATAQSARGDAQALARAGELGPRALPADAATATRPHLAPPPPAHVDAGAASGERPAKLVDRLAAADADSPSAATIANVDPAAVVVVPPAVDAPSDAVKTMATVTVPSAAEASARTAEGREAGVRAAEVAGHRRALAGEAHGRIVVPELGKIEVRAIADAAKIDVHVRAEESHAKRVIAAHAPDLSAHVQREIPEARVFVERPADAPIDTTARDLAGNHGESRHEPREERGDGAGARPSRVGSAEPSVRRHQARVRIVL
ncbi:MAG: hypothetical protein KF894_01300 [Labilithrix sp.]|nr:hypothetical protein [Labilithrix sp.]